MLLIFVETGRAAVQLAPLFSDGAVLQRGKSVPIWGTADPGKRVEVQFGGQKKTATVGPDGRWRVELDPLEASSEPAELIVTSGERLTISNVLVGEVWLCSGQSNMYFPVSNSENAQEEIAKADWPQIRQFLVRSEVTEHPAPAADGDWQPCSPASAGQFTAVGYFFARKLHQQLGVPVGIIKATLGGSPIEGWLSQGALTANPAFAVVAERWKTALAAHAKRMAAYERQTSERSVQKKQTDPSDPPKPPEAPDIRNLPSGLYNGFIHPLQPYALAGFLWYQGEGNAERSNEYPALFKALITQWRADFGQGDLPFLFVQLPNFDEPEDKTGLSWALMREAQTKALALPETGMAVTIDVGDPENIHPANKRDVGDRLARIALAQVYRQNVPDSGPVFSKASREGDALRVVFTNAAGLCFHGEPSGFEIAGKDKKFAPAIACIEGETVVLRAANLKRPVDVRYAWKNSPEASLFNGFHLPAAPFRSVVPYN